MSEFNTIDQVINFVRDGEYKLVEVLDANGRKVRGNPANIKPVKFLQDAIKPWTKKVTTKQGPYTIVCWFDTRKKQEPDSYPIYVGKAPRGGITPVQPVNVNVKVPGYNRQLSEPGERLSLQEALDQERMLGELKTKNVMLEQKVQDLERELKEFKDRHGDKLAEEQKNGFLKDLLPVGEYLLAERQQMKNFHLIMQAKGDPYLEKHLPYLLGGSMPKLSQNSEGFTGMKPPADKQEEEEEEHPHVKRFNDFMEDEENLTEEECNRVTAIREKSSSLNDFFTVLGQQEPEIYKRAWNFMNGGDK